MVNKDLYISGTCLTHNILIVSFLVFLQKFPPPPPPSSAWWLEQAIRSVVPRTPVMRVIVFRPYIPSLKFVGLPVPKIRLIFGRGVIRGLPMITSTFDLSIYKWVTDHPCHGFLPANFQHAICPSVLDLRSAGMGQTDGRTDNASSLLSASAELLV